MIEIRGAMRNDYPDFNLYANVCASIMAVQNSLMQVMLITEMIGSPFFSIRMSGMRGAYVKFFNGG